MSKRTYGLLGAVLGTALMANGAALAHDYKLTITNMMNDELLAPVLVAPIRADKYMFTKGYVSAEAEHQILTGDPAMLKDKIGRKAVVGHGSDGPPGVLLAPGKSISLTVSSCKGALRVIAMVAPTKVPDNFVTGTINLSSALPQTLDRYDIGHDEGRKQTEHVGTGVVRLVVSEM